MRNREYFTRIRADYRKATDYNAELYRNIAAQIGSLLRGTVVDFGNGGVINYDTANIDKLVCVDVINEGTELTSAKIDHVYGDFYEYELPRDADYVMAQFLLHHLTDDGRLEAALRRLRRALAGRGRLIVVETVLPAAFERLEQALRPAVDGFLKLLRRPALRFFSIASLCALLRRAGFSAIEVRPVAIGRRVSPAPVLFPRLRIPGRLYPLRCVVVEASADS